jgi:hypothetical protein
MPVVFVDPPAIAQPYRQVSQRHTEQVVDPVPAEDLLVAGVVADERDLGVRHCHDGCDS